MIIIDTLDKRNAAMGMHKPFDPHWFQSNEMAIMPEYHGIVVLAILQVLKH